ncbi:uncharacterized protein F4822DRAFT_425490 [Hypoxylon trugodes]|uniref:uncharacterized protein n=1 Tax=Hypoxylon trugodes TaxID=326681 RepID=UPI002194EB63|nr:uncharacterized protein F4822DRAFT_425490 [Hypoxylon trugodes]KAI1392280.1 hypothetical protein F4822DRAFT_425490 [Hypoxylon trugodes]
MGKHGIKSSSGPSKKAKKAHQTNHNESNQPGQTALMRYVIENQAYEKMALGEPSGKPPIQEKLQRWEKIWQAASAGKESTSAQR